MPTKKSTKKNSIELKKDAVLSALEKTLGVITPALKSLDVSRSTYYRWIKEDPDFAESALSVSEIALDFAESQLYKQIKEGNTTATIFYLKTKGKERGYTERQEVRVDGGVYINVARRKAKFDEDN